MVLAQDEENLAYMIRKLNDQYSPNRLEINFTKTEYVTAGSHKILDLEISDKIIIEGTDQFKYLGLRILNDGKTKALILKG